MAIALDPNSNNTGRQPHGVSSQTIPYGTSNPNEVVLVFVHEEPNSATTPITVSSVTDTNGLTWTRRSITAVPSGTASNGLGGTAGPSVSNLEVWWAPCPTATTGTVTVTWPSNIDAAAVSTKAFFGVADPYNPWDGASSLPTVATHASSSGSDTTTPSVSVSTDGPGYLLAILGCLDTNKTGPSGFSIIDLNNNGNATIACTLDIWGLATTAAQSSLTVTLGSSTLTSAFVLDALGPPATEVFLDKSASNSANVGAGNLTVGYATSQANEIIVLAVNTEPNSGTAITTSSVTDSNSLTWTRRSLQTGGTSGGTVNTVEIWWAAATSPITGTITVAWPSTIDDASLAVASFINVASMTTPWDAAVDLPGMAFSASSGTVELAAPFTTESPGYAIGVMGTQTFNYITPPTDWVTIQNTSTNAGSHASCISMVGLPVLSEAVSPGITFETLNGGNPIAAWVLTVDVLAGNVAPTGVAWNPSDKDSNIVLSNGDLTATNSVASDAGVRGTLSHSSSKWYIEYPGNNQGGLRYTLGFATSGTPVKSPTSGFGINNNGTPTGSGVTSTVSAGDPSGHNVQFAIDIDTSHFWFRYDGGAWFGQTSGSADPATGTNGITYTATGPFFPWAILTEWNTNAFTTINPGPGVANAIPSGFNVWSADVAPVGPTGTWASTEAPDEMEFFGILPPQGVWDSTEGQDTWATSSGFAPLGINSVLLGDHAYNGTTPGLITGFTTSAPDTIILVTQFSAVAPQGSDADPYGAQIITSVTDDGGKLTWAPRFTALAGYTEDDSTSMSICTWWAYAHDIISDPIEIVVTSEGNAIQTLHVAYAIQGLNGNYGYPFGDQDNYNSLASAIGSFYPTTEGETDPKLLQPFQTGPLGGSPGPTSFGSGNNVTIGGSGTTVTGTGTLSSYAVSPDITAGGRFYFEVTLTDIVDPTTYGFGVMFSSSLVSTFLTNGTGGVIFYGNGEIWTGTMVGSLGAMPSSGDVIGVNINVDSGNAWFINLSHSGSYWNNNPSAHPEYNVGGIPFAMSGASEEQIGSNGLTGTGPCSPVAAPCGTSSGGELTFDFSPSTTVPGSFQGWPANGLSSSGIYPSILIAVHESATFGSGDGPLAPPFGFTQIANFRNANASHNLNTIVSYAVQTNAIPTSANNFMDNGQPSLNWHMAVDTLVSGQVNPGFLAATDTPDTMRAIGYTGAFGQVGFMQAFENPDVMTFFGFQPDSGIWVSKETPDIFSAYGFQPLTGAWNSSEAPDTFAGTGIGLGEDGTWESTEEVDIFAASGNTPISGTFVTTDTPDRFSALGAGAHRTSSRRQTFVT